MVLSKVKKNREYDSIPLEINIMVTLRGGFSANH